MSPYLLLIAGLSAISNGFVWWLLSRPWRPDLIPVRAPIVVAPAPNMTLDQIGLV